MCLLLAESSVVHAQEPVLVPPRISRVVEASDPRAVGPRVVVQFELDVDVHGHVADARVVGTAGKDLDERVDREEGPVASRSTREMREMEAAALAAVRAFTFEPASRDGKATSARIRYDYVFAARIEPPPWVETPVDVPVEPPPPSAPPRESVEDASFESRARVDAPPREPPKRTLDREELRSVAGTRGDPLRATELLPGVSRPSVNGNQPILRGANPSDSQVFLDGAPVPTLYHLGGLSSFVHSRVLESVDLYPSNFSVRFGRKVGGVIEARVRDPRTDGLHGIAEASILDSSLLVETPIGDKVSALAAVRRSNLDFFLTTAQSLGDLGITTAPVYWDYQTIAAFKPSEADRLRLLAYGSSDRLGVVLDNPSEIDPAVRGGFDALTVFHRVQLGLRHRFRAGSDVNTELTYGHAIDRGTFGGIARFRVVTNMLQGRSEWTSVLSPEVRIVAGLDILAQNLAGNYYGLPATSGEGENPTSLSSQRRIGIDTSAWITQPGIYLEAGLRPMRRLLVSPGIRGDYNGQIEKGSVDPRISTRLEVSDTTTLKAGVGRFSQSPDERLVLEGVGNPKLGMTHALHVSAGVEQHLGETVSVGAEGFVKWVDGVVAATPGGRAPFFLNSQDGRIFGGELLLRVKPRGRFFGFISYTLMRSERRDSATEWRPFDRDQPHIVNATGVYRLGHGWELGATVRTTSGTPYTPVRSSTYDATTDVYSPRLGANMSARNPAFSRVDLRVQKTWTFSKWSLSGYLDVQNTLNFPNREGFSYSYDYRVRESVRGLPILPILGIRGEL